MDSVSLCLKIKLSQQQKKCKERKVSMTKVFSSEISVLFIKDVNKMRSDLCKSYKKSTCNSLNYPWKKTRTKNSEQILIRAIRHPMANVAYIEFHLC